MNSGGQNVGAHVVGAELGARDPERLATFYREAFGFTVSASPNADDGATRLRWGAFELRLRPISDVGRAMPIDSRSNDHWFRHLAIAVRDIDASWSALQRFPIAPISRAAQRFSLDNPAASGIEARYFRDPEGHPLELIRFPSDKGRAQWHAAHGHDSALFLGIDHSAVVVANTDASVAFYRRYGLASRASSSVNQGAEQECLTDVRDARVRITLLSGASGIGLELLEYLMPRDGRSSPSGSGPDDAWFARTHFAGAEEKGLITINAVDPDGHGVRFT